MYQHSHRLHAEVLHVPLLCQVPQKPHRCRLVVPSSQGMSGDLQLISKLEMT